jgi:hypothetical protein
VSISPAPTSPGGKLELVAILSENGRTTAKSLPIKIENSYCMGMSPSVQYDATHSNIVFNAVPKEGDTFNNPGDGGEFGDTTTDKYAKLFLRQSKYFNENV